MKTLIYNLKMTAFVLGTTTFSIAWIIAMYNALTVLF
jgi:hypothetical protein